MRSSVHLGVALLMLAVAPLVPAQEAAPPPSYISFVEGSATIEHDGETEPAAIDIPVLAGDRIHTANGRVEVRFPDGAAILIDPYSDVEFVTPTRARVLAGAIEHRAAEAPDPRSASVANLPSDLQMYASDLDQSGAWQYEPQYGNVWYPAVAADWRPYYYGYWSPVPTYGWTWIGYDPWTWPTHHYGRWGYARHRWFWIPGRTWAAAWVSWGTAPDYVSWCPLGYDGRPVVALSVGYRSTWNAWTVVPRSRFGARGYSVQRYAIDPYRIDRSTPFVVHRNGPAPVASHRASVAVQQSPVVRPQPPVAVPRYDTRRPEYRGSIERSPSPSVAVPRYPSPSTSPNAGARVPEYRAPEYRAPESRAPMYRPPSSEYRIPSPRAVDRPPMNDQRPMTSDDRAYRPSYQPRYQPRVEPPPQAPRIEIPQRAQPRQAAPAAPPPPPPRESAAPRASAPSQGGGHPAGGPHADRNPGNQSSQGTAVRRPR